MGKSKGKKTVTIQLSDETAAMIDRKLKQWSLKNRAEVIEQVLAWYVQPSDTTSASRSVAEML